ncbi:ABC transporter permease [Nocardioides carbamazepini]|uniref:ABC transporter permease n=1 Tax=Nocardioides carbamazepini TaxID=2854259 RepID=UPI00214A23CD|nr:ABC transporter permease [Nocardioides carbamazepini]MCR1784334.1 ABC transporter permease [Nocardioides carbamazepini]
MSQTSAPSRPRSGRLGRASAVARREPLATFALLYLILIVLGAVLAPLLATHDPDAQQLMQRFQPWSGEHWFGTDDYGRDVFSRLVYGSRVTLQAALVAVGVSVLIGVPAGLLAGFRRGFLDAALSRVFDGLMSIPGLILALTIVAVLGPGLTKAMTAVGLIFAPQFFRVTRAATHEVMGETYIESSIAIGCAPARVVLRHVLPNVVPAILVQVSVALGVAVSAEASLSFLGLGVEAPTASWGSMLSTAAQTMTLAPNLVWLPGLLIFTVVLSFTLLGEGIRRSLAATGRKAVDE